MTKPVDPELLAVLYAAVNSELGVRVKSNDIMLLRQRLYVARAGNPEFEALRFSPSPIEPNELWIVKNVKG
jgi:hypothetical protein